MAQDDPSSIMDIATEGLAQSIERSPQRSKERRTLISPSVLVKVTKTKQPIKKGKKRVFDVRANADDDDGFNTTIDSLAEQEPSLQQSPENEPIINGYASLEIPPDDNDTSQQEATKLASAAQQPAAKGAKGKRGRPKAAGEPKQTASNKGKSTTTIGEQSEIEPPSTMDESTKDAPQKRSRGRPRKAKQDVFREPSQPVEEGPSKPAKRAKKDTKAPASTASPAPKKRPPPSARNPNAQITSSSKASKAKPKAPVDEPPAKPKSKAPSPTVAPTPLLTATSTERGKPKPRSLQILRSTTPADADGARLTRSGRTTIKPIEYWRGERIVWTKPKASTEGRVSLPGIQEIVRAEDLPDERRARTPRKAGSSKRRRRARGTRWLEEDSEEEEALAEEWELEQGVLEAEVWQWDAKRERASEEMLEQIGTFTKYPLSLVVLSFFLPYTPRTRLTRSSTDLAIAPKGLSALTKEVKNQNFEYAKTITLPFFHSGMVDIPPGGEKRTRNSRKNHMIFWVFAGRVVVDVSGNVFGVGRGGMWQVPRGT